MTDQFLLLKRLIDEKNFHHAAYRDVGKPWEGLYFYKYDPKGLNGYTIIGCISKTSPDLEAAFALVKSTGIDIQEDSSRTSDLPTH
jgi:hypothetical protein